MIEKMQEICDDLPDIVKAVLFVSAIAIFWDFILQEKIMSNEWIKFYTKNMCKGKTSVIEYILLASLVVIILLGVL